MWERTIQLARTYQPLAPSSELLHEAEWLAYIWLFGSSLFFEDYAGGRFCVVEALRISQSLHKRRAELYSLASLAMIDLDMGDDLSARQRYEHVLPLARALDDPWAEMRVHRELLRVGTGAAAVPVPASALDPFTDVPEPARFAADTNALHKVVDKMLER